MLVVADPAPKQKLFTDEGQTRTIALPEAFTIIEDVYVTPDMDTFLGFNTGILALTA